MTRVSQTEQAIEQRTSGDEEQRVDGQKMSDADVDVTAHRERRIYCHRDQQPRNASVPFPKQSPQYPRECCQRNDQKWQRRFERKGDREVIPPTLRAVLSQQRSGMSITVVEHHIVLAEEVVSRYDPRSELEERHPLAESAGGSRFHPLHVAWYNRRTLKSVGCVEHYPDETHNNCRVQQDSPASLLKTWREAEPQERKACEHRHQHDHRKLCQQRQTARQPEQQSIPRCSGLQINSQHKKEEQEGERSRQV